MGNTPSRQSYEYSYGSPSIGYGRTKNIYSPESSSYNPSRMGWGQGQGQGRGQLSPYPNYGPTPGVMPTQMAYPPMYPRPPQQPQIIFPLVMQPMQQISGLPMFQQQNQPQPQYPLQPQPQNQAPQQQQGIAQMPQPQMPQQQQQQQPQPQPQMPFSPGFGAQMPQQAQMQSQPAQQMPQPQVQQQPQPQVPFSPGFGGQMPQQTQMQPPQMQQQPQSQMGFSPDSGVEMPQPEVPFTRSSQIQRNQTPFPRNVQMPQPGVPLSPNPQPGMQQGPMASPMPPPPVPQPQLPQPQMAFSPRPQMPEPSLSNQGQQQAQNQFRQASYDEGPVIPMMMQPQQQNRDFGAAPGQSPMPQQQLAPSLSRTPSFSTVTDNTNPLPEPPREFEIPAHLLSGTAMAHVGPQLPRSRTPLRHPLPELPRDVYLSKKYRKLLVGSAYEGREKEVYPENWFADERAQNDGPASFLARLNPFRSRHESSASPRRHRRHDTMPEFFEFVRDGGAGPITNEVSTSESSESAGRGGNRFGLGRSFTLGGPFARHRREPELDQSAEGPPVGWMPTVPIANDNVGPQPQQPFSPSPVPPLVAGQGPSSPPRDGITPIRFDLTSPEYSGFCHLSPHRVLYKNTLYPSAVHLLEAHKFLGRRDDIAELVRGARDLHELGRIVSDSQRHARGDWERVVLRKMEDVLYLKFVQHPDLRSLLLNTRLVDLIYAEANDSFWGEGALRDGANELGRALMRVRERLRDESSGRSSQ